MRKAKYDIEINELDVITEISNTETGLKIYFPMYLHNGLSLHMHVSNWGFRPEGTKIDPKFFTAITVRILNKDAKVIAEREHKKRWRLDVGDILRYLHYSTTRKWFPAGTRGRDILNGEVNKLRMTDKLIKEHASDRDINVQLDSIMLEINSLARTLEKAAKSHDEATLRQLTYNPVDTPAGYLLQGLLTEACSGENCK